MWSESPIIGFDTETTGVRPEESRLVTCSLVTATAEGVTRRYWLADPGVEIPESATRVHGITTEQARAEGRPIEEVLTEIADTL
ncbi:MAG: DNA polymerase III subunit epsilon, partial [Actinomycetaceae bacterium]|nr:DNA polymerase III subunit epsilon [Actinomycetaceae bacterium]